MRAVDPAPAGYTPVAKTLHWLVAALLIGLTDTFGKVMFPQWAGAGIYILMAAILLWRLPSSAAMELQDELDGKLGA